MKKLKKSIGVFLVVLAISISFSYKSDFFEIAKQIEIYTTLFKELNLYYIDEINPAEVMDRAISSTLKDLDPYTRFYDEQGVENARISAEGEYGGIGASISYLEGKIKVREVYKGYPAQKAGLVPGDEILKIGNTVIAEYEETYVRSLLKGLPGSEITLEFERQKKLQKSTLKRESIELNPVPYYGMVNDDTGYISFVKFNRKASAEVKKAFLDLKSQGMTKVIIDVRHNPGGLLNEAVSIVNFFIPKNKTVVTTKAKLEKWSTTFKTKRDPIDTEIPITILIDDRSASASEILAGALQDYDRAVIIGQRSFGKGLVQRSRKLSYGTQLKLTISKYYTPSGRCIQELDYTNRDLEKETIPKFSDAGVNSFKTEKGRTVFDGGGVKPDVSTEVKELTATTRKLVSSEVFFDFVTSYFFSHEAKGSPEEFVLDSNVYQELKKYLDDSEEVKNFKLNTEIALNRVLEFSKKDAIEFDKEYQTLIAKINKEKLSAIDENKNEIIEKITNSIVNRFYFKEGEYKYKMAFDKEIKSATEVLRDMGRYNSILGK